MAGRVASRRSVGSLLKELVFRAVLASTAHWLAVDLTLPDLLVLFCLAQQRRAFPGALARQLGLEATNLSSVLKRLEQRGLLLRRRDQRDRRAVQVALTPAGLELVQALSGGGVQQWHPQLAALPPARRRALTEGLRSLLAVLEDGGAPCPPDND